MNLLNVTNHKGTTSQSNDGHNYYQRNTTRYNFVITNSYIKTHVSIYSMYY